ncbi:HNH endonuclease signature motif containing protein [Rhodococcoides yunnanense]|uniref:HNH endonuclease signature motif containing protein n=1 Tax=Rhodococcoides yunnanense TaxID=278209 RepID=UPI0009334EB2|nr:HNH endonuclease signature motif containing protein [Rhodococcus yunnanensis]
MLQELSEVAVLENQACARKVELAAQIWDSCIHQNVQVGDVIMDAGNYAASETAKALCCSKKVADTLAEVGMDLRLRLPAVRSAFAAGELDYARVRAIYRTTGALSVDAANRVETEVLHAARRLSPGPLATEVAAIIQRTAPEEAAELRKDLASLTRVRYHDRDMIATIEADLEPADAAASWQLITEMAATLCRRDPRTRGQRLAAAYSAIMRREDYVACTCEVDEDHPCTAQRELPDRRAPLTTVTLDLATLVGMSDLPGYLAGHGLIDAEYARELAANGDLQLLLTEARNIAEKLGIVLVDPASVSDEPGEDAEDAEDAETSESTTSNEGPNARAGESNAANEGRGSEASETETSETESSATGLSEAASSEAGASEAASSEAGASEAESSATGDSEAESSEAGASGSQGSAAGSGAHLTFHPLGRGRRRRGMTLPRRTETKKPTQQTHTAGAQANEGQYRGSYTLIAALEQAISANPGLGVALYPDGHGGFVEPPAGALQYRPGTELAECVRHRDRTCRHPGCDVPAASCEIDHVVPFLHRDPVRGGWTVLTNLHCLCKYHHMLKTMGVWTPSMLAGGVDYWKSSSGTTAVTLPGGTVGSIDFAEASLLPHIPRKRRPQSGTETDATEKADTVLTGNQGPTGSAPTSSGTDATAPTDDAPTGSGTDATAPTDDAPTSSGKDATAPTDGGTDAAATTDTAPTATAPEDGAADIPGGRSEHEDADDPAPF